MYDRRDVLKHTGVIATSATVGLAGCLEALAAHDEEEPPSYADQVGVGDDGWLSFGYVDWESATEIAREENGAASQLDPGETMHGYPIEGVTVLADRLSVELAGPGLEELLQPYPPLGEIDDEPDRDGPADAYESTVTDVVTVDDALILAGSIDADEIASILTSAPADDSLERAYEQIDELNEYDVYAPADGEFSMGDPTIAVGDDGIVSAEGEDGIDDVDTALETKRGDAERAVDEIPEFEWLIDHAGDGHLVFGGYGESPDYDPSEHWGGVDSIAKTFNQFEQATGVVSSITFEGRETTSAALAAYYEYIDDSFEASLRGQLGSSATERSVAVNTDEHRILVTGTWSDDPDRGTGNESVDE